MPAKNRLHLRMGWWCVVVAAALFCVGSSTAANNDTTWTLAGTGVAADTGDGGQAREAAINQPRSVFATATGGFVWAEPWSNRVRIVEPNGVDRHAGWDRERAGSDGDGGPAAAAELNFVHSAAPTPDGGYLLADTLNSRIRKVSAGGTITTVAGTAAARLQRRRRPGHGGPDQQSPRRRLARRRQLPDPRLEQPPRPQGLAVRRDHDGGWHGNQGFSGDGGPATAAQLSIPFGVAPTADGGFLIVDVGNQRIRKVSAAGVDHDGRRQRRRRLQRRRRACDRSEPARPPQCRRALRRRLPDRRRLEPARAARRRRRGHHHPDRRRCPRVQRRRRPCRRSTAERAEGSRRHRSGRRIDRRRAEQPDPLRRHGRRSREHSRTLRFGSSGSGSDANRHRRWLEWYGPDPFVPVAAV